MLNFKVSAHISNSTLTTAYSELNLYFFSQIPKLSNFGSDYEKKKNQFLKNSYYAYYSDMVARQRAFLSAATYENTSF